MRGDGLMHCFNGRLRIRKVLFGEQEEHPVFPELLVLGILRLIETVGIDEQ